MGLRNAAKLEHAYITGSSDDLGVFDFGSSGSLEVE